jgi:hypothetical protein
MTKIEKALENREELMRVIRENLCPYEFGLGDCKYRGSLGCRKAHCHRWDEEVEE